MTHIVMMVPGGVDGEEDTVREQMKSTEPRNPPRMVSHSVEPSCLLNICMPANTSTLSRLDSTRDVPVFTATVQEVERMINGHTNN